MVGKLNILKEKQPQQQQQQQQQQQTKKQENLTHLWDLKTK